MAIVDHIIGLGTAPQLAQSIVGGSTTGLTGAGTASQANALLLSTTNNFFTTVAASSGAKLPLCGPGSSIFVWNGGSATLTVYGNASTEAIGAGAVGAGFLVAQNKSATFVRASATLWGVNLSA